LSRGLQLHRPCGAKPACFIRGGRSNLLDESDFPAIRACFLLAQFKTIANACHWVHFDAADEFYTMVTDFLAPSAE